MPHQNRVAPTGEIVAIAQLGRWMGNRGCLHEDHEIVRPWRNKMWITCETSFRGRRVQQWEPGRYTPLFFLDEAVALAAGHRPCAECRHPAYQRFLDAWESAFGERPRARQLDERLRADRMEGRSQRQHRRAWAELPDGAFVSIDEQPLVVEGSALRPWVPTTAGYGPARPRPTTGEADVLTPACTVEVLRHGYPVQIGGRRATWLGRGIET